MRISMPDKCDLFGRPLLKPTKSWPKQGKLELQAAKRALRNQEGLGGPEIPRFEASFATLVHGLVVPKKKHRRDGTHVVAVTNGTHAIQLALEALGIGIGADGEPHRVLVPGLTWQATAGAVLDVNAVPVLVDVRADGTIDPDQVERILRETKDTPAFPKVVVAVHLYNAAADVVRLAKICKRWGVFLIEDCAHAVGAKIDGRPLGTFGVMGTFSFQASKGFTTGGEGGAIITRVAHLARRLRSLVSCGRAVDPIAEVVDPDDLLSAHWRKEVAGLELTPFGDQSGNYRLSNWAAAIGSAQAERFGKWYRKRKSTLEQMAKQLPTVPGITYHHRPEVTDPVAYMLAFMYDPDQFAGMDNELFREVLHYLLGGGNTQLVLQPYDPLGGGAAGYRSPVYNPLTKPRHQINAAYVAAIDPSAAKLPNAHDFFRRGITIQHSFLREKKAAAILVAALLFMYHNAPAIVAAAKPAKH